MILSSIYFKLDEIRKSCEVRKIIEYVAFAQSSSFFILFASKFNSTSVLVLWLISSPFQIMLIVESIIDVWLVCLIVCLHFSSQLWQSVFRIFRVQDTKRRACESPTMFRAPRLLCSLNMFSAINSNCYCTWMRFSEYISQLLFSTATLHSSWRAFILVEKSLISDKTRKDRKKLSISIPLSILCDSNCIKVDAGLILRLKPLLLSLCIPSHFRTKELNC